MKKLFKVMFLMIALWFPFQGLGASADDSGLQQVQITVQNQVENPNGSSLIPAAGVNLSLYDLSEEYAKQATTDKATEFLESFAQMSASQVKEYLADKKVSKLQTQTTANDGKARFGISGTTGAYLIIQDEVIDGQTIVPLAFALPLANEDGSLLSNIELYAKPVKLTRAPYFYKYGVKDKVSAPLAQAKFVLGKLVNGEKHYLTTNGTDFQASQTPAKDQALKVFVSDENGLVLCETGLTNGEYFFEEISAPSGYTISNEAKNIAVSVTDSEVKVKGVKLAELVAGMVPSSFTQAPKVLNYARTELSTDQKDPADTPEDEDKDKGETLPGAPGPADNDGSNNGGSTGSSTGVSTNAPSSSTDSGIGGMLAQLGEQKEWVSLIGILMVLLAAMQLYKLKKVRKGSGQNEK